MSKESEVIPLRPAPHERPQAADWLAKLDRGELTADEREEFAKWLREDPRNKDAIRDAASLWYGMNEPLRQFGVVFAGAARQTVPLAMLPTIFWRIFARFRGALAAGGLAAVIGLAAVVLVSRQPQPIEGYFATKIGETRIVALGDGTQVHLNTNTIVEQSYSSEERSIRLIAGEAIFDVAHEPKRPFVVYAADGMIRAVGTRFAVRVVEDKVSVTVTEGRVALLQRSGTSDQARDHGGPASVSVSPVMVGDGEAGEIDRVIGSVKRRVSERDVAERLSWAEGKLVFYDKPLQTVVDEVARYTTVRITVADEALKNEKITGILIIGDVNLMLEGIEGALGVKADWSSPDAVRLTSG